MISRFWASSFSTLWPEYWTAGPSTSLCSAQDDKKVGAWKIVRSRSLRNLASAGDVRPTQ